MDASWPWAPSVDSLSARVSASQGLTCAIEMRGYLIGAQPVTNSDFKAFMDATGHRSPKFWSFAATVNYFDRNYLDFSPERRRSDAVTANPALSAEEMIIFTDDGKLRPELMTEMDIDGENPIGMIPGTYFNTSKTKLVPVADDDLIAFSILPNLLMGDLNLMSSFTAFPLKYAINVKKQDLIYSPNVMWFFEAYDDAEKPPEVGTINSVADLQGFLQTIESQLAMWLQSEEETWEQNPINT